MKVTPSSFSAVSPSPGHSHIRKSVILHLHSRKQRATQSITTRPARRFSPSSRHVVAAQPEQFPSPSAERRDLGYVLTSGARADRCATPPAHQTGYRCPALLLPHTHRLTSAADSDSALGTRATRRKIRVPEQL